VAGSPSLIYRSLTAAREIANLLSLNYAAVEGAFASFVRAERGRARSWRKLLIAVCALCLDEKCPADVSHAVTDAHILGATPLVVYLSALMSNSRWPKGDNGPETVPGLTHGAFRSRIDYHQRSGRSSCSIKHRMLLGDTK